MTPSRFPILLHRLRQTLVPSLLTGVMLAVCQPTEADAQRRPLRERGRGTTGSGSDRDTLTVGGRERHYLVRAPRGLTSRSTPVPLVLVLHGGGGNADNAEQMTGFTRLVERERILVVYPDGTGRSGRNTLLTWNAGHCCAVAMRNGVDDVAFIEALIDRLSATYRVDPARIYVTGMSNGAMMAHRLGRELSHRIAAIAPVVGAVFGDERPATSPVSALMINGLDDASVPADGGPPGGAGKSQWDGTPARPNVDQGHFWARSNGCSATPGRSEQRQVITWRWACPAGLGVEVHQVRNAGHAWPGGRRGSTLGDRPSSAMDATAEIWAFFTAHPKRTR